MDCSAEEQMVRMKLEDMSYIKRLEFNLPERKLEVYHHGDSEEIARSLQELNLGAEWVGPPAYAEDFSHPEFPHLRPAADRPVLRWLFEGKNEPAAFRSSLA